MKGNIFLLLMLLLALLISCTPSDEQPEQVQQAEEQEKTEPIKIGFMGPLTGDVAIIGVPIQKAAMLAEKEINGEGGINGVPIKVIYEDTRCNGKEGVNAVTKLVSVDKVKAIVGTVCSAVAMPSYPIAEDAGVLMMGTGSSSPDLSENTPLYFRVFPSDALQGKVGASVSVNRGYERIAVMHVNDEYGIAFKDTYKKHVEEMGGNIVVIETYTPGDVDFKTQLQKIKQENPDLIYSIVFPKEGSLFIKQAREMGIDAQIMTSETIKEQEFLDAAGEAAEGLIGTFPKEADNDVRTELIKKYEEEYGEDIGAWGAYGYDALNLIAKGMQECGLNGQEIKECLDSMDKYTGATGEIVFDEFGDPQKIYSIFQIKEDAFHTIENVDPSTI